MKYFVSEVSLFYIILGKRENTTKTKYIAIYTRRWKNDPSDSNNCGTSYTFSCEHLSASERLADCSWWRWTAPSSHSYLLPMPVPIESDMMLVLGVPRVVATHVSHIGTITKHISYVCFLARRVSILNEHITRKYTHTYTHIHISNNRHQYICRRRIVHEGA